METIEINGEKYQQIIGEALGKREVVFFKNKWYIPVKEEKGNWCDSLILKFKCPDGSIKETFGWLVGLKEATVYSIKRLSDQEVFTIGDMIYGVFGPKPITEFEFSPADGYLVRHESDTCRQTTPLKYAKKIKIEEGALFTTHDGVEIFDKKQIIYSLLIKEQWTKGELEAGKHWARLLSHPVARNPEPWLYFADKEKRDDYLFRNKPVFSLNDIMSCANNGIMYVLVDEQILYDFAKTRING